jgi:hypothetical protein
MNNLAEVYRRVGRRAEAVKLGEEILALQKARLGPDHPDTIQTQMAVAISLLELGRGGAAVAAARQAIELFEKRNGTDASSLYNAACYRAVTAAAIRASDQSAQGAKEADAEADRAMAWLKQAVAAGWRNAAHLAADHDLDALRARDDFKALVAELERREKTKPRDGQPRRSHAEAATPLQAKDRSQSETKQRPR